MNERPENSTDMRAYWVYSSGHLDKVVHCYHGREWFLWGERTEIMSVPGVRGCALLGEIILVQPAPEGKALVRGVCLPIRCFHC